MPGIAELFQVGEYLRPGRGACIKTVASQGTIADAEKELPLAEAHLAKAQAILGEAILPEKVDVIPAPSEFNQAISRATAL